MPANGFLISCAKSAVTFDIDKAAPLNKFRDFATCSSVFFCNEITINSSFASNRPTWILTIVSFNLGAVMPHGMLT